MPSEPSSPKVSIVVPNYNHEKYLTERLDSIVNQSFQDWELLLLDDASTDHSRELLHAFAAREPRATCRFNTKNSGSPFAQWNQGAAWARGEFLWIAESDDAANPELLQTLVDLLEQNPTVSLAYAHSMLIDESGKDMHPFDLHYDTLFGTDTWKKPFVSNGKEEIRNHFLLANIVPNASGALIRTSAYRATNGADPKRALNGDWLFYIHLLEKGDLAFTPLVLNRFRVHPNTQRQKANTTGDVYHELLEIIDYIVQKHHPHPALARKAYRNVAGWWTHSLYRQQWGPGHFVRNAKTNAALLPIFFVHHPFVLLHIPYEGVVRLLVLFLQWAGIKELLRQGLHRLFPRYFLPHAT